MENKIINVDQNDNYRIVAISDIHGHLEIFCNLLEKVNLKDDDYLVIIGDFINKGPDSYKTYEYMKTLVDRPNTFILKGNHEAFVHEYITEESLAGDFLEFLKKGHYETLIHDFAKVSDFDIKSCGSGKELYEHINENFSDALSFIDSLPALLHFDEFTFVHGGFDETFDIKKDETKFLKFDNYNEKSGVNQRKIIVGHWPTCNLRTDINTNVPQFNNDKNIISIDGGLGVKSSGELNALIIEKTHGDVKYQYVQENDFPKKYIKEKHQFKIEDKVFVNYPHFDFEVIKKGETLTLCRHSNSNKLFSVFNSLIEEKEDKHTLKTTFINHFLNLDIGSSKE